MCTTVAAGICDVVCSCGTNVCVVAAQVITPRLQGSKQAPLKIHKQARVCWLCDVVAAPAVAAVHVALLLSWCCWVGC
jgi:hypothetical protein